MSPREVGLRPASRRPFPLHSEFNVAPATDLRPLSLEVPCRNCQDRATRGDPENWQHPACTAHLRAERRP